MRLCKIWLPTPYFSDKVFKKKITWDSHIFICLTCAFPRECKFKGSKVFSDNIVSAQQIVF